MVKLTKALIKKYGVSKKAWAVARSQQSSRSRVSSSNRIKTRTKVNPMARRKSYARRSGLGSFSSAPIKVSGMVADALKGAGASVAVSKFLPGVNIPYKGAIAGYLVGGLAGAVGGYLVSANMGASNSSSGTTFY